MVAILLVLTISYCMMLNRRLKLLKADEQSLRATISELVTATEIAERAIGGLKITVHECDMGLGERLRKAERVAIEIDRAVVSGKDLVSRLSQIVSAGRRTDDPVAAIAEAQRGDARTISKRRRQGRRQKGRQQDGYQNRSQSRCRRGESFCRAASYEGAWSRGMIRFIRDLRLIPIALIASACLLALKTADLVLDSPYFFADNGTDANNGDVPVVRSASGAVAFSGSPDSWAKQMFNFPDGKGAASPQNLPQIVSRRDNRIISIETIWTSPAP